MEFPVIAQGKTVGNCFLEDQGLYWQISCVCWLQSDRVERLYCCSDRVGVLMPQGRELVLNRRVSKASMPSIPPINGIFSLEPVILPQSWEGKLAGISCCGFQLGDELLFPYGAAAPCPCEPLFCFFEIRDGFWRLPAYIAAELSRTELPIGSFDFAPSQ